MPVLLEAAATLAVGAALVLLLTASLVSSAKLHAAASAMADQVFRERQLEHLAERAAATAGTGPLHPAAIGSASATAVVFQADLDGNGAVDATSSETTALEVANSAGTSKVRIRLGRQTMTVLESTEGAAALVLRDRSGLAAGASNARLVELNLPARASPAGCPLLVALPARVLP